VRYLLAFVSKHGYALFGWWRIIVGLAGIAGLYALGQLSFAPLGIAG